MAINNIKNKISGFIKAYRLYITVASIGFCTGFYFLYHISLPDKNSARLKSQAVADYFKWASDQKLNQFISYKDCNFIDKSEYKDSDAYAIVQCVLNSNKNTFYIKYFLHRSSKIDKKIMEKK